MTHDRIANSSIKGLFLGTLLALVPIVTMEHSASAAFHLWKFSEAFTNADGSIQFIEMVDASDNEQFTQGVNLKSNGHTLVLGNNVSVTNTTANHRMLFATSNFAALAGGVSPDYIIPANFFSTSGDTLVWFTNPTAWDTRALGTMPTDGVLSRTLPGTGTATNSPTNFAGNVGSVNLSTPSPTGDYNGNHAVDAADYVLWRKTLNNTVSPNGSGADGSGDGTINAADYDFWRARFGNSVSGTGLSEGSSVPEPVAVCGWLATAILLGTTHRRRSVR